MRKTSILGGGAGQSTGQPPYPAPDPRPPPSTPTGQPAARPRKKNTFHPPQPAHSWAGCGCGQAHSPIP